MNRMTKRQILKRLHYIKSKGYEYSAAVKVVTTPEEIADGDTNGAEVRIVPVIIDTDEQFDYTLSFVKVMVRKDDREVVFGSRERLEYIVITGAHTEEESNRQIKEAIAAYSKSRGYGTVKTEDELLDIAQDCASEYADTTDRPD